MSNNADAAANTAHPNAPHPSQIIVPVDAIYAFLIRQAKMLDRRIDGAAGPVAENRLGDQRAALQARIDAVSVLMRNNVRQIALDDDQLLSQAVFEAADRQTRQMNHNWTGSYNQRGPRL